MNRFSDVLSIANPSSLWLWQGSAVTMDYRTSRVRVYVDKDNKVQAVPRIG